MLEEIIRKVVSYCEIPKEVRENHWIEEYRSGSFIELKLELDANLDGELESWLRKEYPELIGTKFLIDIDFFY